MIVLGIETSCDETAAAGVADGRRVISSVVATQFEAHAAYGGLKTMLKYKFLKV